MSEKIIHRLSPDQLSAVRKEAGLALSVNNNTTPLEAGMQIGMARVLDILQRGFTVAEVKDAPPGGR